MSLTSKKWDWYHCFFYCYSHQSLMKLTTLFLQLRKLRKKWTNISTIWDYDTDFSQWNFISWEKEIWKRLYWNFNQSTSFHFFENLIFQGILKPKDRIYLISTNNQMLNILMLRPLSTNIKAFSSNQIKDKNYK